MTAWQRWSLSGVVGVAAATLVLFDLNRGYLPVGAQPLPWVFLILVAVAVGAARMVPGIGLAAAWGAGLTQLVVGVPVVAAELVLVAVLFCAARWGRLGTMVAAGVTVPAAPVLAYVGSQRGVFHLILMDWGPLGLGYLGLRSLAIGALVILSLPWLLGLTLRFVERAAKARRAQRVAEEQANQALEVARLKEQQNRLARDVHDVVGHSLAVILAQAEAAQFIDDANTVKLKETMATIAGSARRSLHDVRNVLSPDAPRTPMRINTLLNDVTDSSGRKVELDQTGAARPLPPELEEVAYRVLQEMLTNALKHGRRHHPLQVELAWPDDGLGWLRITVTNAVRLAGATTDTAGSGLHGMHRRLTSVGGRLDIRRSEVGGTPNFIATAWVPVRDSGGIDVGR